jgi:hypothetical protein
MELTFENVFQAIASSPRRKCLAFSKVPLLKCHFVFPPGGHSRLFRAVRWAGRCVSIFTCELTFQGWRERGVGRERKGEREGDGERREKGGGEGKGRKDNGKGRQRGMGRERETKKKKAKTAEETLPWQSKTKIFCKQGLVLSPPF